MEAASAQSPVVTLMGPRSFTSAELIAFAGEIRALEVLCTTLAEFVQENRTTPWGSGSFRQDYTKYCLLQYDVASTLTIGSLTLSNAGMSINTTNAIPVDAKVGVTGSYVLSYDSVAVANLTALPTYQVHHFLRALPYAVYTAIGGMLEEVANAYYRGEGPAAAITSVERASIIRLMAKTTKELVSNTLQTPIYGLDGPVVGADAFAGRTLARYHAENIIRAVAPMIAQWILDGIAPGSSVLVLT
jgi:hypothetical protein